ncbi:MAG: hypothetical protein ACOH5I_17400 [Oligoflexus sp.]
MKQILGFFSVLVLFIACNSDNQAVHSTVILDHDSLALIGEGTKSANLGLIMYEGKKCHAFISNHNWVTSSVHCLGSGLSPFGGIEFQTFEGEKINVIEIAELEKNIITFVVDQNFTSFYEIDSLDSQKDLMLVALDPKDLILVKSTCNVASLKDHDTVFEYKCDTEAPWSGAFLLQGNKLVGMNIGRNRKNNLDFALNLSQINARNDEANSMEEINEVKWSFKRSKRDYCCVEAPNDNNFNEVGQCANIRDYRDELGRQSAKAKCKGFCIGQACPDFPEKHNVLRSAKCLNLPECNFIH